MRLIKIGNQIINIDNVANVVFSDNPDPKIQIWLTSFESADTGGDVIKIIGDLALKTWSVLCRQSVDVEVPTSNPWRD